MCRYYFFGLPKPHDHYYLKPQGFRKYDTEDFLIWLSRSKIN